MTRSRLLTASRVDDVSIMDVAITDLLKPDGMDDKPGHIANEDARPALLQVPGAAPIRSYSDSDHALRSIGNVSFDRTQAALTSGREMLEHGARRLLAKEMLTEENLYALFDIPKKDRP